MVFLLKCLTSCIIYEKSNRINKTEKHSYVFVIKSLSGQFFTVKSLFISLPKPIHLRTKKHSFRAVRILCLCDL